MLHSYNTCCTDVIYAAHVHYMLHRYNKCCTGTIHAAQLQYMLHRYNICCTATIDAAAQLQYMLHSCNICCTAAIHIAISFYIYCNRYQYKLQNVKIYTAIGRLSYLFNQLAILFKLVSNLLI